MHPLVKRERKRTELRFIYVRYDCFHAPCPAACTVRIRQHAPSDWQCVLRLLRSMRTAPCTLCIVAIRYLPPQVGERKRVTMGPVHETVDMCEE